MGLFGAFTDFLSGSVGNNLDNKSDDVRSTKRNLKNAGYFEDDTENEILTRALDDGIKSFQKENDLHIDGILKPGGETERGLFGTLTGRDPDEAFGRIDEMNAQAGSVGFGGNISGTLNAVEKREKPEREAVFATSDEDGTNDPFTTVSGGLRVNKSRVAEKLGESLMAQSEVPTPDRKPEGEETSEKIPVPKRKPLELSLDATGRMAKEKEPQESESSKVYIPQHDPDPVFDLFRENLKPREGGIADRPLSEDRGGLTNQGVTQDTLDNLRKRSPEWNLPEKPTDLTDQQITDILRDEFYERTQIDKLNEIAGFGKTGSKLVEHVFDAGIMSDAKDAGKWLQESIDETIGTDLTVEKNGFKEHDGILGSKTREAMQRAIDQGKILEISRKFWQKRFKHLQGDTTKEANPGWWPRMDLFKE